MKRKDTSGWLFMALVLIASIVCVISLTQGAELINPYENWIETKDLKNCTITFTIDAEYLDSVHGQERLLDSKTMRFENGIFDSANNTFRVSTVTETFGEFGLNIDRTITKECQIVFDSGANNIKSFSASVSDQYVDSYGNSGESVISIKGSGQHFPFLTEIWKREVTESGLVETFDMKNTSYMLWELKQAPQYIEEIAIEETRVHKAGDKYETWTKKLTSFKLVYGAIYLDILFNGYLPRLKENQGYCSWFGGKNDTGIDVILRKRFYEEYIGTTYDSTAFERKEFSDQFDEWMNNRPKSTWERTGLDCGYARELDTEHDYFCAMRWHNKDTEDYNPVRGEPGHQHWWREQKIKVTNTANNKSVIVAPKDWGPHTDTKRVIDLSKRAMEEINATTDVTWVEMCLVDSNTTLGLVTNRQNNKNVNEK
jgi:hypothetical protein